MSLNNFCAAFGTLQARQNSHTGMRVALPVLWTAGSFWKVGTHLTRVPDWRVGESEIFPAGGGGGAAHGCCMSLQEAMQPLLIGHIF